jgi:hypothetical protein
MPAIDLARLKKQTAHLADLFDQPSDFLREHREILDYYVNRSLRSQGVAPSSGAVSVSPSSNASTGSVGASSGSSASAVANTAAAGAIGNSRAAKLCEILRAMSLTTFSFPTSTLFGAGALKELPGRLAQGIRARRADQAARRRRDRHRRAAARRAAGRPDRSL